MVDFILAAPEHRRGDQLPHAQRRDPAADGHAERRRHDPRGPVVDQALQRARREAHRLSGDQHLARLQVPPEGSHHAARRTGSTSTWARCSGWSRSGRPNKEAGITDYKWIDWYREHPVEDDLKLLKWSDEQCGGQAHVDWRPFQHPQLGAVEIGGWDKMNYWRNPPPHLREREAARFPAWMTQIALSLPQARAAAHRGARARPRHLARALRGRQQRLAAGLRQQARAGAQDGARRDVRDPPARRRRRSRWSAASRASKARSSRATRRRARCRPSCRAREITADRAVGEWVVRAPKGTRLALSARAERAGVVRTEVCLD